MGYYTVEVVKEKLYCQKIEANLWSMCLLRKETNNST